jgi:hypothetical protein
MRNCLRHFVAIVGIAASVAVALPSAAWATTFYCGNEDVQCLISAISDANAAQDKSTIWLEPGGTYTLTDVDNDTDGQNGLPSITGDLTIRVAQHGTATLTKASSVAQFRLLHVAATGHLTLRDLVIGPNCCPGPRGAGLLNSGGEVTLERTTFTRIDSTSTTRALLNAGGIVTIKKSRFVSNFSSSGAGALRNEGQMTIIDSVIDQNSAGAGVGGLSTNGILTIFRSRITQNRAAPSIGGLQVDGGSVRISETTFAGNFSDGAIALWVARGTVFVTESAFVDNGSDFSTVVDVGPQGAVEVTNTTFAKNASPGVVRNEGVLVLTNSTFSENIGKCLFSEHHSQCG